MSLLIISLTMLLVFGQVLPWARPNSVTMDISPPVHPGRPLSKAEQEAQAFGYYMMAAFIGITLLLAVFLVRELLSLCLFRERGVRWSSVLDVDVEDAYSDQEIFLDHSPEAGTREENTTGTVMTWDEYQTTAC